MTPPNVSATYTLLSAPMAMPYGWFIRSVSEDPTRTRQSFVTSDGGPLTDCWINGADESYAGRAGGAGHAGDGFPGPGAAGGAPPANCMHAWRDERQRRGHRCRDGPSR